MNLASKEAENTSISPLPLTLTDATELVTKGSDFTTSKKRKNEEYFIGERKKKKTEVNEAIVLEKRLILHITFYLNGKKL